MIETATVHLGGDVWTYPDLESAVEPYTAVSPYPGNPRNGDTDAVAESILTNGVYRPVFVQRSTGYALAGNHLYHAIGELGGQSLPVTWLDVDEATARRIVAVDNRLPELGGYDHGLLLQLLQEIQQDEGGLTGTGYDDESLGELLGAMRRAEHVGIGSDRPDVSEPGLSERRDSYDASGIRYIMLQFTLDRFDVVVTRLEELRAEHGVDDNTELLEILIGLRDAPDQGAEGSAQ
jgi:hypothetical protein